jgi:hypothetical protein
MGQTALFILFIITLLAGAFSYFAPGQKPVPIDPMKFMMENSGFNSVEVQNRKRIQQLNMTTSRGLIKIRGQMEDLALEQNKFLDAIQDQQQILNNAGKDITGVMLGVQQEGEKGNKDILRLQALASEMKDEQRLLVARGQDLIVLNDQLSKNRESIAEQIDSAKINTETSLSALNDRYDILKDQAASFFDKVSQNNQEVRDSMNKMNDQLNDLANNAAHDSALQQQSAKDHIGRMMDKEHEDMIKLAETQEKSRSLLEDARERQAGFKELLNDKLQETKDKIEEERQKTQDQQEDSRQRVADDMQRMRDQRNR